MSVLTLVRHAQASFLTQNYDELSQLGIEQAQRLGAFWLRQEVAFDRVYCGPCARHRQTAEEVASVHEQSGVRFPEVIELPELNEFNLQSFVYAEPEAIVAACPHLRPLYDAFGAADDHTVRRRNFQLLFEAITQEWVNGALPESPELESWAAFTRRIYRAVEIMRQSEARGERVAVFTSGGPIAAIIQFALDLHPHKTIGLIWTLRNAAFTEFFYTEERFTLSTFNAVPHFREGRLLTYR